MWVCFQVEKNAKGFIIVRFNMVLILIVKACPQLKSLISIPVSYKPYGYNVWGSLV